MRPFFLSVLALLGLMQATAHAQFDTLIDNGPSSNRVDIVFLGDGYTAFDLFTGTYELHVMNYLDHMFNSNDFLADPFPRYHNFFNAHAVEVVSNESGADIPSDNIFVDTALDATYESSGIERLLTIKTSEANARRNAALSGTGITADIQLVTVNDIKYGGSGGNWATYAGGNFSAREIALHEIGHSFSNLADEYVAFNSAYPGNEPSEVNVTTDPTGAKWSHWLGFDDPRGAILDIGVFEGARYYQSGIYRPSSINKMRLLNTGFDAVSREKIILDIYSQVDPLDDWLNNGSTLEDTTLWVDVIDPEVIQVEWSVDGQVVPGATGETFNASDFGFGAGTYSVVARAYDGILDHTHDGSLLDLVRRDLDQLEQELTWTLVLTAPSIPGDFDGNDLVNGADLSRWETGYGFPTGATSLQGDADHDQDVDGSDFLIWQRNFGNSSTLIAAVPEPTGICLVCLSVLTWLAYSRNQKS